jgi:hypothetical protein
MTLEEILERVIELAENDQSISETSVTAWVDMAINRINQSLQSNIPVTTGQPTNYVPEFDVRFHESLVLFAVAKYYESDSSYSNSQYFLGQFEQMLNTMQRDMVLKPSTIVDYNTQQIIVTDVAAFSYSLSMPYGSYFDTIEVFINDVPVDPKYYSINSATRTLVLIGIALVLNDKITVRFENNSDLNSPPYQWWGAW